MDTDLNEVSYDNTSSLGSRRLCIPLRNRTIQHRAFLMSNARVDTIYFRERVQLLNPKTSAYCLIPFPPLGLKILQKA